MKKVIINLCLIIEGCYRDGEDVIKVMFELDHT